MTKQQPTNQPDRYDEARLARFKPVETAVFPYASPPLPFSGRSLVCSKNACSDR